MNEAWIRMGVKRSVEEVTNWDKEIRSKVVRIPYLKRAEEMELQAAVERKTQNREELKAKWN